MSRRGYVRATLRANPFESCVTVDGVELAARRVVVTTDVHEVTTAVITVVVDEIDVELPPERCTFHDDDAALARVAQLHGLTPGDLLALLDRGEE